MEYPFGVPTHLLEPVEIVRVKAELKFLEATKSLRRTSSIFGRTQRMVWEEQALLFIETVFLAFCAETLRAVKEPNERGGHDLALTQMSGMQRRFLNLIIDYVFFTLIPKPCKPSRAFIEDARLTILFGSKGYDEVRKASHEHYDFLLKTKQSPYPRYDHEYEVARRAGRTITVGLPEEGHWADPNCDDPKKRAQLIKEYENEVLKKTGEKLTKKAVAQQAGYKSTTDLNLWLRCDKKARGAIHKNYVRVLTDKPSLYKH